MTRVLQILSLAAIVSLALTSHCLAKDATAVAAVQSQQQPAAPSPSLASKLLPKARSARSIGDMFEKMKNKLFGRKQASATSSAAGAASQQVQSVAPSSAIRPQQQQQQQQQQPQWDLSAINQQYSPYPVLGSNYQWPSSAGGANQYLAQYSPMQGYTGASSFSDPSLMSSAMGIQSVGQSLPQQTAQAAGSVGGSQGTGQSNGGILSSASQLIAQYLSPSSASNSQSAAPQSSGQQSVNGQQQQQQQALTPQQSQYNEFASLMDAMVAQTGVGSQRQPTQYLGGSLGSAGPQHQQQQQQSSGQQPQQQQAYGMMPQQPAVGDQDMSGSSSVQSYIPAASAQPASQKSSMVSLAEQLAPGANFNKLVSFPFSLSSNDDTSKEGRYKLHIPFLNTHVKRSDQQAASVSQRQQQQQQQQQQYINSYLSQQQQQQYVASQAAQQQLAAQASQIVPTIVSPQSSPSQSQSVSQQSSAAVVSGSQSASAQPQSSSSATQSQSVQALPSVSSSVSSSSSSSSSSQVSAVAPISSSNSRPAWSVADVQSGSSSSKLIPMSSSGSSSSSADEDQSASVSAPQRS